MIDYNKAKKLAESRGLKNTEVMELQLLMGEMLLELSRLQRTLNDERRIRFDLEEQLKTGRHRTASASPNGKRRLYLKRVVAVYE